jgi:ubiquinone/menaquinone biosynthesis C-methylase UbiE
MEADIWKQRDVAGAFLNERSLHIPDRQRQLSVALRVLRFSRTPIKRVLDLGAGDAIILATVLEAFPQAQGIALDFSPLMLEQARERLKKFDQRAATVEGDLQSPAWQKGIQGTFDAILSGLAIHHLTHERKRELYKEIHDLLNPGGVFLNLEHVASPTPQVEEIFNDMMTEHLYFRRREKGEAVTPDQVRQDYLGRADRAANILASVEDQCHWLREIGFVDVDCFWKFFELAIFGGGKKVL